jgi:hypothetical protein
MDNSWQTGESEDCDGDKESSHIITLLFVMV